MISATALLDIHDRAHRSLRGVLDHVADLSADDLNRELDGFGAGSVRLQIHHALTAERYWFGVLEGRIDVREDQDEYADVPALESLRADVFGAAEHYLKGAEEAELNGARVMDTWGGKQMRLVPAHVVMRTVTHLFQHLGQVTAMCRLLGRPVPRGLDYEHGALP